MSTVGRTWELWAQRHANGKLWHVGSRRWVELHGSNFPLVPVLVEEILDGWFGHEVTHYGWQYVEGSRYRHSDAPVMIYTRTGDDPKRAMMFLEMCFPGGLDVALKSGEGNVVALRITVRDGLREQETP